MANQWLRLWHDLPSNAKIRIVSKSSGLPVHLVISVYITMLVDASCHEMSRGVTTCHDEEIAVTIECDTCHVTKIRESMQGWLLDGNKIKGWDKRQPKKEDLGNEGTGAKSAMVRKREERERKKEVIKNNDVTICHDMSRNVTTDKIRLDKDLKDLKDKSLSNDRDSFSSEKDDDPEQKENSKNDPQQIIPEPPPSPKPKEDRCPYAEIVNAYHTLLPTLSEIQRLNEKRKRQIRVMWKNNLKTLTEWENYFKFVGKSDFLMGRVQRRDRAPFKCSIDFLTNENNFLKICEDMYHG